GNNGTLIPTGRTVKSDTTGENFVTVESIALSPTLASGVSFRVVNIGNNTDYQITYTGPSGSGTITYSSTTGTSALSILQGLQSIIESNHPNLTATVVGDRLSVLVNDVFQSVSFTHTNNLGITDVAKVGQLRAVNP